VQTQKRHGSSGREKVVKSLLSVVFGTFLLFSQPASAQTGEFEQLVGVVYQLAEVVKKQSDEIRELRLRVRRLERRLASRPSVPTRRPVPSTVSNGNGSAGVRSLKEEKTSFVVATLMPSSKRVWRFLQKLKKMGFEPRIAITPRRKLVVVVVKATPTEARRIAKDAYRTTVYRWENLIPVNSYEDLYYLLKGAFENDKPKAGS